MITEVPLIVDAGVGTASDATIAMELGYDRILMNTAIAAADGARDAACGEGWASGVRGRADAEEALCECIESDGGIGWVVFSRSDLSERKKRPTLSLRG